MSGEGNEPTYPCKVCGRKFIRSSLEKHEPACKKITKMHRRVFDSGKQRAENSDIPYQDIKKAQKEKEKHGGVFPRPKTHWRERHQEFVSAVSASKHVREALKTGGPLPPPPKTSVPSDYICCTHCGRTFSEQAGERHIPFCKELNTRKGTSTSQKHTSVGRSSSTGRKNASAPTNKQPHSSSNGGGAAGKRNSGGAALFATPQNAAPPPPKPTTSKANRPPSRRSSKERPPTNQSQSNGSAVIIGGAMIGGGDSTGTPASRLSRRSTDADTGSLASHTNSTSHSQRGSHLPTPTKRSNSAPRNPNIAANHKTTKQAVAARR
ncbi:zinc-finger of a c2HC-type domain-containing protein [Ditylenchus destructor]|nr:zinc-finger of a c2HC-type domain-containing protein [Ditylenchus destructor]